MAKCEMCKKHGFFFKVNSNGICKDCERKKQEEARLKVEEETQYNKSIIENIQFERQKIEQPHKEIKQHPDTPNNGIPNLSATGTSTPIKPRGGGQKHVKR